MLEARLDDPRRRLAPVLAAFFASGFAALVYQVAWQRLLLLQTGVGLYSVATVVAAFMFGLGVGSRLGATLALRLEPRSALIAFGAVELSIAVFGLASPFLYDSGLGALPVWLSEGAWRTAALHTLALLPPTTLMGLSLPLLVRAAVADGPSAGRTIGLLYGINVLGAACGAAATPWLLLRFLGIVGATHGAAGLNLLAAGLAALLVRGAWPAGAEHPAPGPAPEPDREAAGARPLALWLGLYALSGGCALALEIVWFRVLEVALKSTAFTFGTLLALYLLGSAAGSLLAAPRAPRLRRPLRAFVLAQCTVLLGAALPLALLVWLPPRTPGLRELLVYWGRYDAILLGHAQVGWAAVALYLVLPILLFGLPTLAMGFSFPVLQRAVQDDPGRAGHRVGLLQAANITGCVVGSLLVGLGTLSWIGTTGTLRLLLLLALVFVIVGLAIYGADRLLLTGAAALLAMAWLFPGQQAFWTRLHGLDPGGIVEEDATGVVGVLPDDQPATWFVSVNGRGHSRLPYAGAHTWLGALPALVHPAPAKVAVVGLGSGNTAWAASCRTETRRVDVYEILARQPPVLHRLALREHLPRLSRFLADPRIVLSIEDGRLALARGEGGYDIAEADALQPDAAGSGNLFSREFFAMVSARLAPGGLMCTWAPTPRVRASFQDVFPHVLEAPGVQVLLGSQTPLPIELELWESRLRDPEVQKHLGGASTADRLLARLRSIRVAAPAPDIALNTDLFPRDEFATPQ
jgi:spermidine synthase